MASTLAPSTPRPKPVTKRASLDSGGKTSPVPKCFSVDNAQRFLPERSHSRPVQLMERRRLTSKLEGQDNYKKMNEHISCKHDRVRTVNVQRANSLGKEGWKVELEVMKQRYESALLEVQSSKQAMEGLRHELMVCVEAKDEAVRLAGEAMCAAESTARQVEQLSAGNGCTLIVGEGKTAGVDDLIDDLLDTLDISLLETEIPLKSPKREPSIVQECNKKSVKDISGLNADDREVSHAQNDMGQETRLKALVHSLEILQKELMAAKEAEETAKHKVFDLQADMARVQAEAEKSMTAESITHVSFVSICEQLEEAEEKLAKASVENAAFVASLEYLKAELEKNEQIVMEAFVKETIASRNRETELLDCMEKMEESNQAELRMWEEKEASSSAMIQTLQTDLERYKSEAAFAAEKDCVAAAKVCDLINELERCRTELIEQQKHSSEEMAALNTNFKLKEAELVELETKQAEVDDLKCTLSELRLKVDDLSSQLSHSKEENLRPADLYVKEQEASTRVTALNIKVLGLKEALKEAIDAETAVRYKLSELEVDYQGAMMETNEVRGELQAVYHQMELSKLIIADFQAEARIAKGYCDGASCEDQASNRAAVEEVPHTCKFAEDKFAREEPHSAEREKLEASFNNVAVVNMEVQKTQTESQLANEEDAELMKAALAAEKERANALEIEAIVMRSDVARLQLDAMEAVDARKHDECRLQRDMELLGTDNIIEERHTKHTSQDKVSYLKEKLSLCEERLQMLQGEADTLQSCNLQLVRELESARAEKEASKRAVVDARQLLSDMEKAKRLMEADIQRLLDDSKLWKSSKDARDILPLSEINGIRSNGRVFVADSRDEKPQPDSPDQGSVQCISAMYLHDKSAEKLDLEGETVVTKEDENDIHVEETPMRAGKKKKNALLHRLHSYLDKKKTVHVA